MALRGKLEDYNIANIVALLSGRERTGVLSLEDGNRILRLVFKDGMVVNAEGTQVSYPDLLNHLVGEGRLERRQAQEIQGASVRSNLSVIDLLLLEGGFSRDELTQFENRRLQAFFLGAFTWLDGSYCFESKQDDEVATTEGVVLQPSAHVEAGRRRLERMMELAERLQPGEYIYKVVKTADPRQLSAGAVRLMDNRRPGEVLTALAQRPLLDCLTLYEAIEELLDQGFIEAVTIAEATQTTLATAQYRQWEPRELSRLSKEFVKLFTRCVVSYSLYPATHPMVVRILEPAHAIVTEFQAGGFALTVRHFEGRLFVNNQPLPYPDDQFSAFIELLKQRLVRAITFLPGIDREELSRFVRTMCMKPAELKLQGGLQVLMKRGGVYHIQFEGMHDEVIGTMPHSAEEPGAAESLPQDARLQGLIHDSPEKIAEYIRVRVGSSEAPTLDEFELQMEIAKGALEQLHIELLEQKGRGAVKERRRLIRSVFEQLPAELRDGLLFTGHAPDSPILEVIQPYGSGMGIESKVDLYCRHFDSIRAIYDREGAAFSLFLDRARENFDHFVRNTLSDGEHARHELVERIRINLGEAGVPIADIKFILTIQALANSKVMKLLEQLQDSDPLILLHQDFLNETKDVIKEICINGEDSLLGQVIHPYRLTIEDDSPQIRRMGIEAMRQIAEELVYNTREKPLGEIVESYTERLRSEDILEVYMVLAATMEKLAKILRARQLAQMAGQLSAALAHQLEDDSTRSPLERKIAAQALGAIGDENAVSALVKLIQDKYLHEESASSLKNLGDKAIQPLVEMLAVDTKRSLRYRICNLLRDMGKPAVPYLLRGLRSNSWYLRRNACMVLGKTGDRAVVPAVGALLDDKVSQVRREVVVALGNLGGHDAEQLLIQALKDSALPVKRLAATYLGRTGGAAAVKALTGIISKRIPFRKQEDDAFRSDICHALGRLGDKKAIGALSRIMKDMYFFPNERKIKVSIASLHAMAAIGGHKATKRIIQATRSRHPAIRSAAEEALVTLDRKLWENM
ncbi:HEAT repeat domain-containing protein [bacterium]|nr:HEAT repeat domain-containing protein [candidate division CSSED10-310 bacterium]